MAINDPTLITRFWSKVDRHGADECWPWLASKDKKGVGRIKVGGKRGVALPARRIAYQIANGDIPEGMSVRLSCDDASCCNPAHIFLKPISISPEERIERNRKRHRIVKIIRDPVCKNRVANKATYIYGLVDPRTNQLRYIGKTVLKPGARARVHKWHARRNPHKSHSMAWLLNLATAGLEPEIFTIETIPPGGDWVEAEQFWIAYFRSIGADLCNHTLGGEGRVGRSRSASEVANHEKARRRGPSHPQFGKPMPPHVKRALEEANSKKRQDLEWSRWAKERRRAGMTAEAMAKSIAGLKRAVADPDTKARAALKRAAKANTPEAKARVSAQSSLLWATRRADIIAAQNSGKLKRRTAAD